MFVNSKQTWKTCSSFPQKQSQEEYNHTRDYLLNLKQQIDILYNYFLTQREIVKQSMIDEGLKQIPEQIVESDPTNKFLEEVPSIQWQEHSEINFPIISSSRHKIFTQHAPGIFEQFGKENNKNKKGGVQTNQIPFSLLNEKLSPQNSQNETNQMALKLMKSFQSKNTELNKIQKQSKPGSKLCQDRVPTITLRKQKLIS
jgi:hypothetical protein